MVGPEKAILLAGVVLIFVLFIAAPALIALVRRHPERQLIYKLSPLCAFSFILWGALIVWAASDKRNDGVISKYVAKLREKNSLPWVIAALLGLGVLGSTFVFLRGA